MVVSAGRRGHRGHLPERTIATVSPLPGSSWSLFISASPPTIRRFSNSLFRSERLKTDKKIPTGGGKSPLGGALEHYHQFGSCLGRKVLSLDVYQLVSISLVAFTT